MSDYPSPPPFWEQLEFWLIDYALIAPCVLAVITWRRSELDRRVLLRRYVLGAAALALVAHLGLAWDAWTGLIGRPAAVGAAAPAWGPGQIAADALLGSAVVWTVLAYTVGLVAVFRRPPAGPPDLPWRGMALMGGLLAVGVFVQLRLPPLPYICFAGGTPWPAVPPLGRHWGWGEVDWIGHACALGGIVAVLAACQVLILAIKVHSDRGPLSAARTEELREGLLLWGFLLFAGALLFLEWRAVDLAASLLLGGAGTPTLGSALRSWTVAHSIPLSLAFAGLVAACFGGLHLRHPEPDATDARAAA